MKKLVSIFLVSVLLTGCSGKSEGVETLKSARDNYTTVIVNEMVDDYEVDEAPVEIFDTIYFDSNVGQLPAYITKNPEDGQKHPAIIWLVGGHSNSISDTSWSTSSIENDQSGRFFRDNNIVTMYPALRGGNKNTSSKETWYGELDDILSAYEYLASLDYVDPNRIYLGGHSVGGTKAILTAEYTDKFRGVFSFGPIAYATNTDEKNFTFDKNVKKEVDLRSPILWLDSVTTPLFIFEGIDGNGEILNAYINEAEKSSKANLINSFLVEDADHFNVLAPVSILISEKILADTGDACNISFSYDEIYEALNNPELVVRDYYSGDDGFKISLPYDWYSNTQEGEEDIFLESDDGYYFVDMVKFKKDDVTDVINSLDEFTTFMSLYDEESGLVVENIALEDVGLTLDFTDEYYIYTSMTEDGDSYICDSITFETDEYYYIFSIGGISGAEEFFGEELLKYVNTFEEN